MVAPRQHTVEKFPVVLEVHIGVRVGDTHNSVFVWVVAQVYVTWDPSSCTWKVAVMSCTTIHWHERPLHSGVSAIPELQIRLVLPPRSCMHPTLGILAPSLPYLPNHPSESSVLPHYPETGHQVTSPWCAALFVKPFTHTGSGVR